MHLRLGILLTLLLSISSACNFLPTSPQPTPVPATQPLEITAPSEAVEAPTPAIPAPLCVHRQEGVELSSGTFEDYPEAVLAFLNAGGTPEELDSQLYADGVANQPRSVGHADMTGNGRFELVVSIFDPNSTSQPPGGLLMIYTCEVGEYRLAHREASRPGKGAPGIRYLQDLNGDRRAELVIGSPTCGAHTCFEEFQALAWDGREFRNVLVGDAGDIPFPEIRVVDPESDGVFRIEVSGSGFGSVGAGPPRNFARLWSWDEAAGSWQEEAEILEPSNYRIHVLHDAEAAARRGDFEEALLLYGRVMQDADLEDWSEPEQEKANLTAYALYKSAVVYTLMGNEGFALTTLNQLRTAYPSTTAQYGYVEMAAAFQQGYREAGPEGGCLAAMAYAAGHEEQVLEPLGPQWFGYGNPEISAEEVCPWE